MSIDCGQLALSGKDGGEFRGTIQLGARLDGQIVLKKHPRAGTSDDHPDYVVEYASGSGRLRPIGSAWIKNSDRIGDFFSITVDDPDWSSPLNLTAFPSNKGHGEATWIIVWSRPRAVRAQDQGGQTLAT